VASRAPKENLDSQEPLGKTVLPASQENQENAAVEDHQDRQAKTDYQDNQERTDSLEYLGRRAKLG
jgi:hypothetical protein